MITERLQNLGQRRMSKEIETRKKVESEESTKKGECLMRMRESWIDLIMLCKAEVPVTTVYVFSTSSQMVLCAFLIIVRHITNTDCLYRDSLTVGRKEFQRSSDMTRSLPSSPKRLAVVPPKPQSPGEPSLQNTTQNKKMSIL